MNSSSILRKEQEYGVQKMEQEKKSLLILLEDYGFWHTIKFFASGYQQWFLPGFPGWEKNVNRIYKVLIQDVKIKRNDFCEK